MKYFNVLYMPRLFGIMLNTIKQSKKRTYTCSACGENGHRVCICMNTMVLTSNNGAVQINQCPHKKSSSIGSPFDFNDGETESDDLEHMKKTKTNESLVRHISTDKLNDKLLGSDDKNEPKKSQSQTRINPSQTTEDKSTIDSSDIIDDLFSDIGNTDILSAMKHRLLSMFAKKFEGSKNYINEDRIVLLFQLRWEQTKIPGVIKDYYNILMFYYSSHYNVDELRSKCELIYNVLFSESQKRNKNGALDLEQYIIETLWMRIDDYVNNMALINS